MIVFAIVLGLIVVVYFATALQVTKAYGQSEGEPIRLQSVKTPEQKEVDEKVKAQWLADFNILLEESQVF
jgi:predicted membrane protein